MTDELRGEMSETGTKSVGGQSSVGEGGEVGRSEEKTRGSVGGCLPLQFTLDAVETVRRQVNVMS